MTTADFSGTAPALSETTDHSYIAVLAHGLPGLLRKVGHLHDLLATAVPEFQVLQFPNVPEERRIAERLSGLFDLAENLAGELDQEAQSMEMAALRLKDMAEGAA